MRHENVAGRFVLCRLPLEVVCGVRYEIQVEQESVSKELRLFARDIESPSYRAYLVTTASKREDLDRRMFIEGLLIESRPVYAIFQALVGAGKARAV
jgi:hypothetical protein